MELGWQGTMTATREEAKKEAVFEMLRALVEDFSQGVKAQVFVTLWGLRACRFGGEHSLRGWAKPAPLVHLTALAATGVGAQEAWPKEEAIRD